MDKQHKRFFVVLINVIPSFLLCKKIITSKPVLFDLVNAKCSKNHRNFDSIVTSVFNCCVKNQLKRIDNKHMLSESSEMALRKVRILAAKSCGRYVRPNTYFVF